MPSRPPSPAGETPETEPSSVFPPVFASMRVIVPSSREDTSRSPPGRPASPHGVFRPSVTVRTTVTEPLAGAADSAAGAVEEEPAAVPLGVGLPKPPGKSPPLPPPPEEQPAVSRSAVAASAARTARRRTIMVPSQRRPEDGFSFSYTPRAARVPDPCRPHAESFSPRTSVRRAAGTPPPGPAPSAAVRPRPRSPRPSAPAWCPAARPRPGPGPAPTPAPPAPG